MSNCGNVVLKLLNFFSFVARTFYELGRPIITVYSVSYRQIEKENTKYSGREPSEIPDRILELRALDKQ